MPYTRSTDCGAACLRCAASRPVRRENDYGSVVAKQVRSRLDHSDLDSAGSCSRRLVGCTAHRVDDSVATEEPVARRPVRDPVVLEDDALARRDAAVVDPEPAVALEQPQRQVSLRQQLLGAAVTA